MCIVATSITKSRSQTEMHIWLGNVYQHEKFYHIIYNGFAIKTNNIRLLKNAS